MRFIADGMMGKLARWLRLAGHDVVYIGDENLPPGDQDDLLLARAKLENRTLLTSDLALHRRARKAGVRCTFIRADDVVSQLIEVSKQIGQRIEITPESSRCPVCNGSLRPAGRGEIKGLVPETVARTHQEFWKCNRCQKVYWRGRHWKTIIDMASDYNRRVK